jgi:PAS domain S-box-containing protein
MPANPILIGVLGSPQTEERVRKALAGKPFVVQAATADSRGVLVVAGTAAALPPGHVGPMLLLAPVIGAAELDVLRSAAADVLAEPVASDAELGARIERLWRHDFTAAYDEVISYLPDGVAVVSRQGEVLSLNAAATAILGWPERVTRVPLFDLARPVDPNQFAQIRDDLARGDGLVSPDLAVILHTGRRIRIAFSAARLPRDGHALISFRDVTVERETELELRRASGFLEHLIDSSSDAIIAADLQGKLLVFNRAAEQLFGVTSSEAKARLNVVELYPQGGAHEVMRLLREAPTGHIEAVRAYGRTQSDEVIPVELSASLLKMKDQEIGSVGLLRDIRERVRVEHELARTRARLNEVEKQREITALAGATAHEMNQPLTVIFGRVDLLLRKAEGMQKQHLQAPSVVAKPFKVVE